MPLGVITKEQFNKELTGADTPRDVVRAQVVNIERGRTIGRTEVPEVIRQIVAEEVIDRGGSQAVADKFGLSKSSVDAYKNGATSTASYNRPDSALREVVDNKKDELTTMARGRLSAALSSLTDDKIGSAKARDIASIAKSMSGVIKDMEPTVVQQNNTQVVVYRPRQRDEDEFDVITVNE